MKRLLITLVALSLSAFATKADMTSDKLPEGEFPSTFLKNPNISLSQIEDLQFHNQLGAADIGKLRPLNAKSLALIKHFESLVLSAYDDPSGYCTIGWGHLLAKAKCNTLDVEKMDGGRYAKPFNEAKADVILAEDTATSRTAIKSLVTVNLNDDQFGAVTSLIFNIGKGNFRGSSLQKLINNGKHKEAAQRFGVFVYSAGQRLDGLVYRRKCESTLYSGALQLPKSGKFDRSACTYMGISDSGGTFDLKTGVETK